MGLLHPVRVILSPFQQTKEIEDITATYGNWRNSFRDEVRCHSCSGY